MSWVAVGLGGAGLLMGYMQGEKQQKAQKQFNDSQAEVTRYSPWTGMRGQVQPITADPTSSAMQGAFQGAMFGMNVNKGMAGAKPGAGAAKSTAAPQVFEDPNAVNLGNNKAYFNGDQYDKMQGFYDNYDSRGFDPNRVG